MARLALVVDDSMLIRHTVCRFLEERGFTAESATNGREALELIRGRGLRPYVILTDLVMPVMTGGEFIEQLKADSRTAAIPVILLVSKHGSEPPAEAKHAVYVIYKDIEILMQLEKALAMAMSKPADAKPEKAKPRRKTPHRRKRRPGT
jgi:CheY-like chemotaxis protein